LPDGVFSNQKSQVGKILGVQQWKVYFTNSHLEYFVAIIMVIWYVFSVLVCCTKKNLAALTMKSEFFLLRGFRFA
jgi:hypothetical protein